MDQEVAVMPKRKRTQKDTMTTQVRSWISLYKRNKGVRPESISLGRSQYNQLCSEMRAHAKLPGVAPVSEPITHFEGVKLSVMGESC